MRLSLARWNDARLAFSIGAVTPRSHNSGMGSLSDNTVTVEHVLDFLGDSCKGILGSRIGQLSRPVAIDDADGGGGITFCSLDTHDACKAIETSKARLVLVKQRLLREVSIQGAARRTLVGVENPRLEFIRVVAKLFAQERPSGISKSASIHPGAKLGQDVYIGPHCCIGECEIGDRVVIHGNVNIYSATRISNDVTVHAGTVIGADGFGYERTPDGSLVKFPHLGGVVIESDVEIGSNCCIDRGTLNDTRICRGAKLDDLVYVAHNVVIGEHALIVSHVAISGSASIGGQAWISSGVTIRDKISVGKSAFVGMGAAVTRDVPPEVTVVGVPAKPVIPK